MNVLKKANTISLTTFFVVVLIACGNPVEQTVVPFTNTPLPITPSRTPWSSSTPRPPTVTRTPLPTMTIDPAYQSWLSTAISVSGTQKVEIQETKEILENEIAQFIIECDGVTQNAQYGSLSPSKNWIATYCGRHNLLVQNKAGTKKWLLRFEDFLHPNLQSQGTPGRVYSLFWDADESYLYFSTGIGWSGGGDECFSWDVRTGLFRLNLKNGTWVTLVNPSEYFPGDQIEVSPTGRRYVTDTNEILITDIYTGEVIQISAKGVMGFRWSPDGTKLAYSTSSCNEEGLVTSSSVYIWDALTNNSQLIFTVEKEVLRPTFWDDNSTIRFEGEKHITFESFYTLYVFDITINEIIFIGPTSLLP